jgi:translation elongation factor EF-4
MFAGYKQANVVRLNFSLNGNAVDALAAIVHKDQAEPLARSVCLCQHLHVS